VRRVLGRLNADRVEKIELMLQVVREEVQRHEGRLREIGDALSRQTPGVPDQPTQNRFDEWFILVQDGLKKSEQTRAKERVRRIGRILAASLVRTPAPKADDVEEMMRVAMELSDRDVELLSELVRVQSKLLNQAGRTERYSAWNSWPQGSWGERIDGELDSVFGKLESFGLVTRLAPPNNLNIMADYQNRYALLKKGLDFIKFVQRS
jgi:chemotaxis protein histidine kinase CheA